MFSGGPAAQEPHRFPRADAQGQDHDVHFSEPANFPNSFSSIVNSTGSTGDESSSYLAGRDRRSMKGAPRKYRFGQSPRQEFLQIWNVYAENAKELVPNMSILELASVVRSCCRVDFTKHSLLKKVTEKLFLELVKLEQQGTKSGKNTASSTKTGHIVLEPRLLCQFLLDLAKLEYLKPPLFLKWRSVIFGRGELDVAIGNNTLGNPENFPVGAKPALVSWRTFDLPLLVTTLARIGLRDVPALTHVCRRFALRVKSTEASAKNATVVAALIYNCAVLNFYNPDVESVAKWSLGTNARDENDEAVREAAACGTPATDHTSTCVHVWSTQEKINVLFALVIFHVGAASSSARTNTPAATTGTTTRSLLNSSLSKLITQPLLTEQDTRAQHQLRIIAACSEYGLLSTSCSMKMKNKKHAEQLGSTTTGEGKKASSFDVWSETDSLALRALEQRHGPQSYAAQARPSLQTHAHTSVFQKSARRVFDELGFPFKEEVPIGPYQVDYLLKHRVAVEFDGFSHFYMDFSGSSNPSVVGRTPTSSPTSKNYKDAEDQSGTKQSPLPACPHVKAKTRLKHALLSAMGVRVIKISYHEWLPTKHFESRKKLLCDRLEAETGLDVADFRLGG
ncbi:unnamed protein product [Amoebophrya sp. A25]|nr:unnamed protein product [Amoebophrya sp. A25]|eukprot:GSA25T00006098001.1